MIDATIVRAHQYSASVKKKTKFMTKLSEKEKGGLSTKIYAVCDALGNSVGFHLTAGQDSDLEGADVLMGEISKVKYDKERHLIENFFAKIKQYGAIATRYDKIASNFLGAVYMASIMI